MRALLDTHAFLWWVLENERLSPRARQTISDGNNQFFLSAASAWEIVIKARAGRLRLPDNPGRFITQQMSVNTIQGLPIQLTHALHVATLPGHHRDLFDRMLIAQSQLERLPILTSDPLIARYPVEVIW